MKIKSFYLTLALLFVACHAAAQNPLDVHYSPTGRGSVGDNGSVNAAGGYFTSVPLSLPWPRGELEVPFSIQYTGDNRVGAAGAGFAIPLFTVERSNALSRRKPLHGPALVTPLTEPRPAERMFVTMGKERLLMVKTSRAGKYRPFASDSFIELEETSNGWVASDLSGRRFEFTTIPEMLDDNVWFLTRVADRTGKNWVSLDYEVYDDKISPVPVTLPIVLELASIREIVLSEISYSYDESGTCPKHRIDLSYSSSWGAFSTYEAPFPPLLDVSVVQGRARAHKRLLRKVEIFSQSDSTCETYDAERVRTYLLSYAADKDTGRPRLSRADMFGVGDDASDIATGLPVVHYEYGSALNNDVLAYANSSVETVPGSGDETEHGFSVLVATGFAGSVGVQSIADISGDGRADYVVPNEATSELLIAGNIPDAIGDDNSKFSSASAYPGDSEQLPITFGVSDYLIGQPFNPWIHNTWRTVIDFNGDGRPDLVQAALGENPDGDIDTNYWRILLNTPGPSGNPGDIEWVERDIDVSELRSQIKSFHPLTPDSISFEKRHLPLGRSRFVGARDNSGNTIESGAATMWGLFDVNGDTFPDFVFSQFQPILREGQQCDDEGCETTSVVDLPDQNRLMVIYHTGIAMAGGGVEEQATWKGPVVVLREKSRCGIQRFVWGADLTRQMTCGYSEVNGDAIVDYIVDGLAIRSTGLPQALDQLIPENSLPGDYGEQELKRAIFLPGPVNVIKDNKAEACPRKPGPGGTSELDVPGSTSYFTRQLTMLRDVTGDAIADYVYYGKRGEVSNGAPIEHLDLEPVSDNANDAWWVMVGTGVGFTAPRNIKAPAAAPFEIHKTRERCDGLISSTVAAAIDIDGDGRLDIVQKSGTNQIRVSKLVGSSRIAGAHDAGLLTSIRNGYGATTHIEYRSAKAHRATNNNHRVNHDLPWPQIVVTEVRTTTNSSLDEPLAPFRYAYGGSQLHYHPLLGRWYFPGYRRRVILRGLPASDDDRKSRVKGTATIIETLGRGDLTGADAFELYALLGKPQDAQHLNGLFSNDPRDLLGVYLPTDNRWRGNQHSELAVRRGSGTIPPLVNLEEECYDIDPFGVAFGDDLSLCRRNGISYTAEFESWEGTHFPLWPSVDYVQTKTIFNVDEFGRPTRIWYKNDLNNWSDDFCAEFEYAQAHPDFPPVRDALHMTRVSDCRDQEKFYAGLRYRYDDLPEGQVKVGMATNTIVERYDTSNGTMIESYEAEERSYDGFGNVVSVVHSREDGAEVSQITSYDDFGLVAEDQEIDASGVPEPLIQRVEYDPLTLELIKIENPNGEVLNYSYDNFGRPTMQTIQKPNDDVKYVLSTTEYLNFDGIHPEGRQVRERVFHEWTPTTDALVAGSESTSEVSQILTYFDELGRVRYSEYDLGSDYGGQSLVANYVERDGLGRPRFAAAPHLSSEVSLYGTTYHYFADNRLECAIDGVGIQMMPATTVEAVDRYPTCFTYGYGNFQLVSQRRGPNELLLGTPQYGAYDEEVSTAIGQVESRTRRDDDGEPLELAEFKYDPLGQITRVTRFSDPAIPSGAVTWKFNNDSLGRVLTTEEPATAPQYFTYDRFGQLTTTTWTDDTGDSSVDRTIEYEYDGLARLVTSHETANGTSIPESSVQYKYDVASVDSGHAVANNLLGRLSHTLDSTKRSYLSYDVMGQPNFESHIGADDADGLAHKQLSSFGPTGRLKTLSFMLPDSTDVPETATYSYDTAGRTVDISWSDSTSETNLWTAHDVDEFGRYRHVELGNGVMEYSIFRPDRRREQTVALLQTPANHTRLLMFLGYDDALRLKSKLEVSNVGPAIRQKTTYEYDQSYRLARATTYDIEWPDPDSLARDEEYKYDGLGNRLELIDHVGTKDQVISRHPIDRDRICSSGPPASPPQWPFPDALIDIFEMKASRTANPNPPNPSAGTAQVLTGELGTTTSADPRALFATTCDYEYDALGSVMRITSADREFAYNGVGRATFARKGDIEYRFRYDAHGGLGVMRVDNPATDTVRVDHHYNGLMERTKFFDIEGTPKETAEGGLTYHSYIERSVPGPGGIVAVLRKTDAGSDVVLFPHGEYVAIHAVTAENGMPVQNIHYSEFGSVLDDTGDGSLNYFEHQWNGGEALLGLELTHIGARLYDPAVGRFLQRDPELKFRDAGKTHPYASFWNDPVNLTDPTGMDPEGKNDDGPQPYRNPTGKFTWQQIGVMLENRGLTPTEYEAATIDRHSYYGDSAPKFTVWMFDGEIIAYQKSSSHIEIRSRDGGLLAEGEPGLEGNLWYDPINFIGGGGLVKTAGQRGARAVTNALSAEGGKKAATRVGRFFYDNRAFKKISREYWKRRGPANGRSLHHWLAPQRATWMPQGLRNGGWNLLTLPKVLPGNLGLNQWMGFAARWGGTRALIAQGIENGIRLAIPASLGGAGYGGYKLGTFILDPPKRDRGY